MSASTIIFYILAFITLGGAILAVTSPKIFRSAIYLLFSLIGIAGLYFWLNYEFIAAVQVVVYVGGIVVLIIFSIFLTQGSGGDMKDPVKVRSLFAGLACLAGYCLVYYIIQRTPFVASFEKPVVNSVQNIGAQMLSTTEHGYLLPFEVVSMLLLAAMVGCIVIAIKTRTSK
jgi:NADH-quinone oxidoreductase subunit J